MTGTTATRRPAAAEGIPVLPASNPRCATAYLLMQMREWENPLKSTDPLGLTASDNSASPFQVGQNMNGASFTAGAVGIGPITGYPETGSTAWRSYNDTTFTDSANAYNQKYGLTEGSQGYVDPKTLKAWAMVESGGTQSAFQTDPLQVNNAGDWDPKKSSVAGLSQGQEMTPATSSAAALEWRRYKGYVHDAAGNETSWRGDSEAFRRYNGNTSPAPDGSNREFRDWYAERVLNLAE